MPGMMEQLDLWIDGVVRDGPENMAVDEWLLRSAARPVLRIYGWEPNWGSYGYFVPDVEAAEILPGMKRVRRWTGGGIVDHRSDWTYTLAIPRQESLSELKGGESYRLIHEALAQAMTDEGHPCRLSNERTIARGGECFVQAVEYDLLDAEDGKLAGAGQRRTTEGLLHQGSLARPMGGGFGRVFAARLANQVRDMDIEPERPGIEALVAGRYAAEDWRDRR